MISGRSCMWFHPLEPAAGNRQGEMRGSGLTQGAIVVATGKTRLAGRATITRGLSKSGQRLYAEMSFAVVRGSDGTIVGSVAVARDATLRFEEERSRLAG